MGHDLVGQRLWRDSVAGPAPLTEVRFGRCPSRRSSRAASSRNPAAPQRSNSADPAAASPRTKVWLELALTAADLLTWTQALCLTGELARAEPAALRYRLLHVAARLVRTARRAHLKIDRGWPWAADLAAAFARLRAAP